MGSIPRQRPSPAAVDTAAGLLLVVAWSSGFIGAELGTRHAPAETLLAWRYVVAAGLACVVLVVRRRPPRRRALARHAVIGLLCQALYLGGVVTGVGLGVPPGTAALIAAWQPLVVAGLEHLLLGSRTTTAQRVALAMGVVGVAMVVSSDVGGGTTAPWAYLLPLGGMLALSVGTVLEQRWELDGSVVDGLSVQTIAVAAVMVVAAASTAHLAPPADRDFWGAVAWVVVLSTLGGYGFYFWVLRRSGPTAVSTWLYLTPPSTMLWAAVAFGDRPGPLALVGTAVSALAVALAVRRPGAGGPAAANDPEAVRTSR
jgi:drug/metabolite transporter (DMT)-like permease